MNPEHVEISMTTIGIIGAGNIGSQIARAAIATGHDVVISNSRNPETLSGLVQELGDHARAATASEAAEAGDFVVVTIPLKNIDQVPVEPLAGKVVIDTNNYYPQRDGQIAELDAEQETTLGLLQNHLPDSRVVKGFNHIMAGDITTDGSPANSADRRALATAGDDEGGKQVVTALYDQFGFDTVDVGSTAESWRVERDQPAYVVRQNASELKANLALAERNKNSA